MYVCECVHVWVCVCVCVCVRAPCMLGMCVLKQSHIVGHMYVEQSLAIIATIIAQQAASDAGPTDHNPPSRAQGQGSCSSH